MSLVTVTYTSQADRVLDDSEIEALLAKAQWYNARDQITGILIYNGYDFLQLLEGRAHLLEATLDRIKADPLHRNLVVVDHAPLSRRAFPDWTMGYLKLSGVTNNAAAIDRALHRSVPTSVRAMLAAMADSLRVAF